MAKATITREGICLFSDSEIVWRALIVRCGVLERVLKKELPAAERRTLQDEYERTFALTEKYRRGS